jgi:cell fate regulator YaaT (PSP1 superfamily)
MPQLVSLKFSEREMPKIFACGPLHDVQVQEFVVAPRDGEEDVGYVAAIEYVSTEQLKLRRSAYKPLVRRASEQEKEAFFLRRAKEKKALSLCKTKAREFGLPMKISTARLDPSEGRYVFHFTSEQRVDFRQLVRELAALLKARIELWQIGVRDEGRLIDGFGECGLRTCCSSWLTEFRPINLRMAKEQDINLPPNKLSGLCGRLLCCLSYEVDQYREMGRQLLAKGATIEVGGRKGVIMDRNILTQSYQVQFEDGASGVVKHAEIGQAQVPEQMKQMARFFKGDEETPPPPPREGRARDTERSGRRARPEGEPPAEAEARPEGDRRGKRRRGRAGDRDRRETASPPSHVEPVEGAAGESAEEAEKKRRRRRRRGGKGRREDQPAGAAGAPESGEFRTEPRPPAAEGDKEGGRTKRRRRGGRGQRKGRPEGSGGGSAE